MKHKKTKVSKEPKEKAKCALCSYTAAEGYRMKRHMRVHTGEKPFMCGMCDQSFTQKSSLKEHLWKHTVLRSSHKCPHCNAVFNQPADVKAHIVHMHAVCEEAMPCGVCPEVFHDNYSLLQHQKSHKNMFRFQCLECAFSSRDKSKLLLHLNLHSKKKPLQCSSCKTIFKHKHELLTHLFEVHGINSFGDDFSKEAQPETEDSTKLTNQQELEQQYHIMDEHGNTIQLSEADAEAIHNAMQQTSGNESLQIVQSEEGTMMVTVLTVDQNLGSPSQDTEENLEAAATSEAVDPPGLTAETGSGEGSMQELQDIIADVATSAQADETSSEPAVFQEDTAPEDADKVESNLE